MGKFTFLVPNLEYFILLLCLCSHLYICSARDCMQLDNCRCQFDDDSGVVDLSSIGGQTGVPLIQDVAASDGYSYSFNPCFGFSEGTCQNAAGCQVDLNGNLYYNIGDANRVTLTFDGTNLIGTYVADDGARTSIVTYQCDENTPLPTTMVSGETSPSTYGFTIIAKACCPSGAAPPSSSPGPTGGPPGPNVSVSIGVGWVLFIVFICIVTVYLVGGVLFNKMYRKESGRDVVPNVTFWTELPGLVKDGFFFTVGKIRRKDYQPIK